MTKEELREHAKRWRAKADRAFERYQETGAQKYYREYCNADDMAGALKMAAEAADTSAANIHIKAQLADFAYKAWLIGHTDEESEKIKKTKDLLAELVSFGVMEGVIRNDE